MLSIPNHEIDVEEPVPENKWKINQVAKELLSSETLIRLKGDRYPSAGDTYLLELMMEIALDESYEEDDERLWDVLGKWVIGEGVSEQMRLMAQGEHTLLTWNGPSEEDWIPDTDRLDRNEAKRITRNWVVENIFKSWRVSRSNGNSNALPTLDMHTTYKKGRDYGEIRSRKGHNQLEVGLSLYPVDCYGVS